MRKNLLFIAAALFSMSALRAQDSYLNARLHYSVGKGIQEGKFEAGGIGLQYEVYKSPTSKLGFVISGDWQLSGTATKTIDLNFSGSTGSTDVNYSSSMNKFTGGLIYAPLKGSFVTPYASLQGGVLWYRTKFYINDPRDNNSCSPETNRNVKMSLALASTAEAGIKVKLHSNKQRDLMLQANAGYTVGTRARYIKLSDDITNESIQAYTAKFKMSNGTTHEHIIGKMYHTASSQLCFNLGVSFQLK